VVGFRLAGEGTPGTHSDGVTGAADGLCAAPRTPGSSIHHSLSTTRFPVLESRAHSDDGHAQHEPEERFPNAIHQRRARRGHFTLGYTVEPVLQDLWVSSRVIYRVGVGGSTPTPALWRMEFGEEHGGRAGVGSVEGKKLYPSGPFSPSACSIRASALPLTGCPNLTRSWVGLCNGQEHEARKTRALRRNCVGAMDTHYRWVATCASANCHTMRARISGVSICGR
jgi:hypothetical protein